MTAEKEEPKQEIKRVILEQWEDRQYPLLISELGSLLSLATKSALVENRQGLKRYILEHLEGCVRVIPMANHAAGGVVPAKNTQGITDEELERLYENREKSNKGPEIIPMYWGDVWRAFQNEINEESVRYIRWDASGRPLITDAKKGSDLPENAKQIEASDLVLPNPGQQAVNKVLVNKAIEAWCSRNSIARSSLEFSRNQTSRQSEMAGETPRRATHPGSTASKRAGFLMRGFDLLSREELSRIHIPADLVLAILERSGLR